MKGLKEMFKDPNFWFLVIVLSGLILAVWG